MMESSFVDEQAAKILEIAKEEHRLKVELLNLDLQPQSPESFQRNLKRQWVILGTLRSINMDMKMPILRSLVKFVDGHLAQRKAAGIAVPKSTR